MSRETWRVFWRQILFLCQKELLAIFKDKRTRIILVVPVIIQGFLFSYAANYNLEKVPYAVVDQCHSAESDQLLARLDGSEVFQRYASLSSVTQLSAYMDNGQILLAVVIPQDFAKKLHQREVAPVQVITDGKNSSVANIANGYVTQIIAGYNAERTGGARVTVEVRNWFNPNQLTRWTFLPGLIAMISFVQVIMLAGLSIAREREQGTFDQLLVTPLSSQAILVGKALPPVLVGLVQSSLIFLIARFWFEIPFVGSLFTLYLVLLLFNISSTGFGLSISAISANMQQVLVYVLVFMIPMCLLSGVATPVKNMPVFLQYLTYIDPLRFAIEAVRRIYLEGASLDVLWVDLWPLLAIIAVTMPLAGWLFRSRTD